jgi:hypothetical protein
MLLTSLPFDYATLVDVDNRTRTSRKHKTETRVRRVGRQDKD